MNHALDFAQSYYCFHENYTHTDHIKLQRILGRLVDKFSAVEKKKNQHILELILMDKFVKTFIILLIISAFFAK